jgi:hypothetical protein
MVPEGHYLAVRGTLANEEHAFNFHRGGAWAFFSAPEGTPQYPGLEAIGDLTEQPVNFDLQLSNYPNPFNPTTTIEFTLPHAQEIELIVYNVRGQQIALLAEGIHTGGLHRVTFDTNLQSVGARSSRTLPSGVYFYTLIAGERRQTGKLMLIR